jgi:arylsulfatase
MEVSDNQVGKLLDHLKQIGQYNNTMIIFTSDNEPEGSAPEKETFGRPEIRAELAKVIAANNNEANLGNANSYFGYGPGWAQAGATPLFGYKIMIHEAGTRVPLLIKLPNSSQHRITNTFAMALDLVPTILDYAGVTYPDTFKGNQIEQLTGKSVKQFFEKVSNNIHNGTEMIPVEFFGSKAVYHGNLKALNIQRPIGDGT